MVFGPSIFWWGMWNIYSRLLVSNQLLLNVTISKNVVRAKYGISKALIYNVITCFYLFMYLCGLLVQCLASSLMLC